MPKMKYKNLSLTFSALLLSILSASADIMLDDFNTNRTYGAAGDAYGAYQGFMNVVTQNGGGTLVVNASLTERGGFYHDGLTTNLWNFYGETGLVVRARELTNNSATKFFVLFQDNLQRRMWFEFPFSSLSTTGFLALSRELTQPDHYDPGFNPYLIKSMDIQSDHTDASGPTFGLELDHIQTVSPSNTYVGLLKISASGTNAVLTWPTNVPSVLFLQKSTNLAARWMTNSGAATISGTNYTLSVPMIGVGSFFQLGNEISTAARFSFTSAPPVEYSGGVETNYIGKGTTGITPPTKALSGTASKIDVSSYAKEWRRWDYVWHGNPAGPNWGEGLEIARWSDHAGGTNIDSPRHHYMTNSGTCWGLQCSSLSSNYVTWNPSDTNNWPKGWLIHTVNNCNPIGSNYSAQYPEFDAPFFHVNTQMGYGYFTNTCSHGETNWVTWIENTTTELHVVGTQAVEWVKVSAAATEVGLLWFGDSIDWWWLWDISPTNIALFNTHLNADGMVFRSFLPNNIYPATPVVNGGTNYEFYLDVVSHKVVPLTWAYHEMFHAPPNTAVPSLSDWQQKYDAGSRILARDDDQKIPPGDPSVASSTNATSLHRTDDSPVYVEFKLSLGPTNYCSITRTLLPVFPTNYATTNFFNIRSDFDVLDLVNGIAANVKIVKDIDTPLYGNLNGLTLNGVKPSATIMVENVLIETPIHEWGHSCGLYHRGEVSTNGVLLNPGSPTNNAVMSLPSGSARTEVNWFERDAMNSY